MLIGDAAGYNDPIIGQGLSITYRDVRIVRDILLAGDDWSPAAFAPYAEERAERMRRLRFVAALASMVDSEFGPEAEERRRRAQTNRAKDPTLELAASATMCRPGERSAVGVRAGDHREDACLASSLSTSRLHRAATCRELVAAPRVVQIAPLGGTAYITSVRNASSRRNRSARRR